MNFSVMYDFWKFVWFSIFCSEYSVKSFKFVRGSWIINFKILMKWNFIKIVNKMSTYSSADWACGKASVRHKRTREDIANPISWKNTIKIELFLYQLDLTFTQLIMHILQSRVRKVCTLLFCEKIFSLILIAKN